MTPKEGSMSNTPETLAVSTSELPHAFTLVEEPLQPSGLALIGTGELDIATVETLRDRLDAAVDAGVSRLIIDLSAVRFLDSVALAVIVTVKRRLAGEGRMVVVVDRSSYVMLVFECSGLPGIIEMADTRDEAVAMLDA
jgi:anti-sigma B factor antagonist